MFSYRHIYHAGNHADVFKHIVLTGLILSLQRKPGAYNLLDTHAGLGTYDLTGNQASKNSEFKTGISRIFNALDNVPELVTRYLGIVHEVNPQNRLQTYPGSPMIARKLAREDDQLMLCEYNKTDYATLKECFNRDRQVAVHYQDGFTAMKAYLPPKLKRGLVLIDAPYESKEEVYYIETAMQTALKKWPIGIYAIWYPILDKPIGMRLRKKFMAMDIKNLIDVQLTIKNKPDINRMTGSGMFIINSPYQFDKQLEETLPWLQTQLAQNGEGYCRVETLKAE